MPITIRLDQTVKGLASWVNATTGAPVAQVNPVTIASADPTKVNAVKDISDGGIILHPVALCTDVPVSVTDSAGKVATDTVTVVPALPPVGTIAWGPPQPA